jgi:hypothetical protein
MSLLKSDIIPVKIFLGLAFLTAATTMVFAQGENNSLKGVPPGERVVFGGGMGVGFGSVQDFVSVSPSVGYLLTRKLVTGVGIQYRYTSYKVVKPAVKLNDYGVAPFARFMLYNPIFLHAEYEYLNFEHAVIYSSGVERSRQSFDSVLAGGGILQPLGKRFAFYAMALYNFSYKDETVFSAYDSPLVIRAGITIGGFGF